MYVALAAAATIGCQSPIRQGSGFGMHPSDLGQNMPAEKKQAKPWADSQAVAAKPSDGSSDVVRVGYNHGRGMMQNRTFAQRVARAVPSRDGHHRHIPPHGPAHHHGDMHGPPVDHHHMMPHHPMMAQVPMGPRFTTGRTQIRFVQPTGMKIAWQPIDGKGEFTAPQLQVPARYNFQQGQIYRLKVTDLPNRPGQELYPTLEVYPGNAKVDAYLAHNAVPIEMSDEDFDHVLAGNYVTKVIYLPDAQYQELAIAGVETLVSTRLDPGVDPVMEANRRGAILAVVRMGSVDLEMPHSPPLYPTPAPPAPAKPAPPQASPAAAVNRPMAIVPATATPQ
jgi:hypothetical protein